MRFLRDAVAYCARSGVTVRRLLTDDGSAFRSKDFAAACKELGVRHRFTRPYRPQTSGKAERFIQSALREWAYGFTYPHSSERTQALGRGNHLYNWHRPHQGTGRAVPMSRLRSSRNNLLTLSAGRAAPPSSFNALRRPKAAGAGRTHANDLALHRL